MAGGATRATGALDKAGAVYQVHRYAVSEKVGQGYGEAVAAAIGMDPARVFKTLVAEVDGEPVVAVIPVDRRLSTKNLARALGGKHCSLASTAVAERETGYVIGGISPFGQRKRHRLILDSSAVDHQIRRRFRWDERAAVGGVSPDPPRPDRRGSGSPG